MPPVAVWRVHRAVKRAFRRVPCAHPRSTNRTPHDGSHSPGHRRDERRRRRERLAGEGWLVLAHGRDQARGAQSWATSRWRAGDPLRWRRLVLDGRRACLGRSRLREITGICTCSSTTPASDSVRPARHAKRAWTASASASGVNDLAPFPSTRPAPAQAARRRAGAHRQCRLDWPTGHRLRRLANGAGTTPVGTRTASPSSP